MRTLHAAILGAATVAVIGLGTSAWAADSAKPAPAHPIGQSLGSRAVSKPAVIVPRVTKPIYLKLILDTTTAHIGQAVRFKGAGCNPGTEVFLGLGGPDKPADVGTVTANTGGTFGGTVRIPSGTPVGATALWAACKAPLPAGKQVSTAALTITG